MKKALCIIFAILVAVYLSPVTTLANSAQSHWSGTSQTGAIITDQDCPIVVEKEVLTLDLQNFPSNHYESTDEFLAYDGKVSAQYTFYNPADYSVTATLVFPFGVRPSYSPGPTFDANGNRISSIVDAEKYTTYVNGQPVPTKIRHTFSYGMSQFNLEEHLPFLIDCYVQDQFYSRDLQVIRQDYVFGGIEKEYSNKATAAFTWPNDQLQTKLLCATISGAKAIDDGTVLSCPVKNNDVLSIYFVGQAPSLPIELVVHETNNKFNVFGDVSLAKQPVIMSFEDFVFTAYEQNSGISENDWYNAFVAQLNAKENLLQGGIVDSFDFDLSGQFLRWYEYQITLGPKERIVNVVNAPIYPDIDLNYTPHVCKYVYLLSPASTWNSFGTLEIIINTPYFVTECSIDGLTKSASGYSVSLNALPNNELIFSLCTEESPTMRHEQSGGGCS